MGNGRFLQGNRDQMGLGHFAALADRFGNFNRLAQAQADAAMLITGDDERAKTEAASAFDHFGGTIDKHHFFDKLRGGLFVGAIGIFTRRGTDPARTTARAAIAASLISSRTSSWFGHSIL
jgi:hypothetical protein